MEHWTELTIIRFLRKLETLPCLWNGQHKSFREPATRASALFQLSQHMNINGYGAEMMRRKMTELRMVFIKEKRRMYELRQAGQPFRPKIRWYYIADNFWGKVLKIRKYSFYTDDELQAQNGQGPREESTALQRQDDALAVYLGKAVNAIRHITALSSGNEFDAFGRSVACQLKNMHPKGAYELQAVIQRLITEKKIRFLTANAPKRAAAPTTTEAPSDSKQRARTTSRFSSVCKDETIDDIVELIID